MTDVMSSLGYGGREDDEDASPHRRVRLTLAADIKLKPVRWALKDRVPVGEVTLTPGKGGVGKSTFHAWMIAHLTTGTLPGVHCGAPRACIIAAAEDSWERTVAPRLVAAGTNMNLVYRVDVVTITDHETSLSLPVDYPGVEAEIVRVGAVLLSVDPLMSTISASLDTHKDRDVRQVLEPLARLADRTGCAVLGNAHFNKSAGSDPMSLIMGSAAFGNVARAALGFAQDTESEDGSCVISQVKNNLGRLDLPSLRYRIEEATVATDDGPAYVGKLVMLGESDRSVSDILRDRGEDDDAEERDYAATWLREMLASGRVDSTAVYAAAKVAGISKDQAKRAKKRIQAVASHPEIAGPWYWSLPDQGSDKGAKSAGSGAPTPLHPLGAPLADRVEQRECSICGKPLDPVLGDATTHPNCSDAEQPMLPTRLSASVPTPADIFSSRRLA